MSKKKDDFFFSALPFRATGDKRLSAADLRVLMAIAGHDQLNKNGRGCEASNPRLATLSNCDLKALSRSITNLINCGYVKKKPKLTDRRQSVLTVIYSEFDYAYFAARGGGIGSVSATKAGSNPATEMDEGYPSDTHSLAPGQEGGIGDETASILRQIGSRVQKKDEESQGDASPNIFCETEINPDESVKKLSEAAAAREWASETAPSKSVGSILGMIERKIKSGKMTIVDSDGWRGHIDHTLLPRLASDSVESRWARRLSAELDAYAQKLEAGHGSA